MLPEQEHGLGKSSLTNSTHKEELAYKLPSGYSDTSLKSKFYLLLLPAESYYSFNLLDLSLSCLFQLKKSGRGAGGGRQKKKKAASSLQNFTFKHAEQF